ncbi:hypothetical protein Tco_0308350 [Tanacetum coccineum]
MSKLDRFLVTEGIISLYPSISALCLDCHLSDHRPILLREVSSDFGPTPFRFYQSWLRMEGFNSMVEHAWLSFSHSDSNAMVRFKKKLQDLNSIIRLWVKDKNKGALSIRGVFFEGTCVMIEYCEGAFKNHFERRRIVIGCAVLNILFVIVGVYGWGVFRWVAWDNVLASKLNGGLGVSSFFALNRALLLKWVWRFISGDGSLWCKVIQAIYGSKFDLHRMGTGSGASSVSASFRRDVRDGAERQQWDDISSILNSVVLSSSKDRWTCDLSGDGEFKDVSTCCFRCDVVGLFFVKFVVVGFGLAGVLFFLGLGCLVLSLSTFFRLKSFLEGVFMLLGGGFGGFEISWSLTLHKLDAKADIGIFVGYAPAKKAFRIYNKRTKKIIETIHVTFDELTTMAFKQFSSRPSFHSTTPATSSSGLVPTPVS